MSISKLNLCTFHLITCKFFRLFVKTPSHRGFQDSGSLEILVEAPCINILLYWLFRWRIHHHKRISLTCYCLVVFYVCLLYLLSESESESLFTTVSWVKLTSPLAEPMLPQYMERENSSASPRGLFVNPETQPPRFPITVINNVEDMPLRIGLL